MRGTGTPNDEDEVNKRDVSECDGCVCDLEGKESPSIFNVILSTESSSGENVADLRLEV